MLLLNQTALDQYALNNISIHLMLLLNTLPVFLDQIGSHFNTSYVVIKRSISVNSFKLFLISIHLMLLLNETGLNLSDFKIEFQYILCCY